MRRTNALQDLLTDLTRVFHDERVPVEFTSDTSHAAADGSHVAVCSNLRDQYNLPRSAPKALELRTMVDHLSHEIEHVRESNLRTKEEFVDEWQEKNARYARLAGYVINVLEDAYIDANRVERFPGLRQAHAYSVHIQMNDASSVADDDQPLASRLAGGFWQVSHAGYANGIEDADPEVRATLAKLRDIAWDVRDADATDDRYDLANDAMDVLLDVLPDAPADGDLRTIEVVIDGSPTDSVDEIAPDADDVPDAPGDGDDGDAAAADDGDEAAPGEGEGGGDEQGRQADVDADGTAEGTATGDARSVDELLKGADPEDARVVSR